jgi:hypothetical protein
MNRLHQLRQTLPRNLRDNYKDKAIVEFVLADIGPTPGLVDWLNGDVFLSKCWSIGYLKVVQVVLKGGQGWHASWAKNTAHRAASLSSFILVNLDGDVFIGGGAGVKLIRAFRKHPQKVAFAHLANGRGTYGCMAYPASLFWQIGGYNQSFLPMGSQDVDLMARMTIRNHLPLLFCDPATRGARWLKELWPPSKKKPRMVVAPGRLPTPRSLRNSKAESVANVTTKLPYSVMNQRNMRQTKAGIGRKAFVVNGGLGVKGWPFSLLRPTPFEAKDPKGLTKDPTDQAKEPRIRHAGPDPGVETAVSSEEPTSEQRRFGGASRSPPCPPCNDDDA